MRFRFAFEIQAPSGSGPEIRQDHPGIAALSRMVLLAGLFFCLLSAGCQSHRQLVQQAHQQYRTGDFDAAVHSLSQARERPRRDEEVLMLDQAMVHFSRGEISQSSALLKKVRDRFDEGPGFAGAHKAAAYLTDDNSRLYVPDDHEKILIGVLLALLDLAQDGRDAMAYAHQLGQTTGDLLDHRVVAETGKVGEKENGPEDSEPAVVLPPLDPVREELAVAPLLRSIIRGSSSMNQDDRLRYLQQAIEWRPGSHFIMQEYLAASQHLQVAPGYGSVYVIALVGRGPVKTETVEPVSSQALLAADQILSALGEYTLPPTIAPVKIATVTPQDSGIASLNVDLNGQRLGATETIADINRLAVARQTELMPGIIARAVVRRVVKKSVVVAQKAKNNVKNEWVSTGYNALGVLWEATERADLRCWALLPGQIQILRVDLPVGTHRLDFSANTAAGSTGRQPFSAPVTVSDGGNAFVLCTLSDLTTPGRAITRSTAPPPAISAQD